MTPYLTLREMATQLRVHRHTVHSWMNLGCPFLRASGARRLRFIAAEVEAWLREAQTATAARVERESVRGRMQALVERAQTRKQERATVKAARAATKRARKIWRKTP